MNKLQFYFDQRVTNQDLVTLQTNIEDFVQDPIATLFGTGVADGGDITPHDPAGLLVDLARLRAYDVSGHRIKWDTTQVLDCSKGGVGVLTGSVWTPGGASTAVGTAGQERWLMVCVYFKWKDSTPRVDGNGETVYYNRDESFELRIVAGAAAAIGTAVKPDEPTDGGIVLGDIRLEYGTTQILVGNIDLSRKDWIQSHGASDISFVPAAGLASIQVQDAIEELAGIQSTHAAVIAGTGTLGHVKVGTGLQVDATGILSVKTGTGQGVDVDKVDGCHAGTAAGNVLKLDGNGQVPLANIPDSLSGKSADKLDGLSSEQFLRCDTDDNMKGSLSLIKTATGPKLVARCNANGTNYEIVDQDAFIHRSVLNDLAELMPRVEDLQPGDVVIWDDEMGGLRKTDKMGDPRVVGVYSDTFGMYLGGENVPLAENLKTHAPIGISGRVRVKVDSPVNCGDRLMASSTPGYATRAAIFINSGGTIIGKVLDPNPGEDGRVWMLVMNA